MAVRDITIEGIGPIKLIKSSASKSIRLSITSSGTVRVSLPRWTPYAAAAAFAHQHQDWIRAELAKHSLPVFSTGQKVGKLHHIDFVRIIGAETASSRVTATKIIVKYHAGELPTDEAVQARTHKAVLRALKKEAEQLLPPRVRRLADEHGFSFRGISAKQLKRRWGSCDSHRDIVFNLFLMELPWDLIDYVILHELTHTEHLHHGSAFWARLRQVCPTALDLKRQIKSYQPIIQAN